jgi:hypothetical protein
MRECHQPVGDATDVELQVRNARITDVDGITSLLSGIPGHDGSRGTEADADLLRSLIYLPNATVLVALGR